MQFDVQLRSGSCMFNKLRYRFTHADARSSDHPKKLAFRDVEVMTLTTLSELHRQYEHMFDVHVDDQDHTLSLLREGSVLGVITETLLRLKFSSSYSGSHRIDYDNCD